MKWIILAAITGILLMASIRISNAGIERIKKHEALRLKPYQDVAGKWTVGWGHLIKPNEAYLLDEKGITREKADQLLREDLAIAEKAVNKYVTVPLTGNMYDALVSFTYNVGIGALQSSTLLKKLNNNEYGLAGQEFLRWQYAGGKKIPGLLVRRIDERELFLT